MFHFDKRKHERDNRKPHGIMPDSQLNLLLSDRVNGVLLAVEAMQTAITLLEKTVVLCKKHGYRDNEFNLG